MKEKVTYVDNDDVTIEKFHFVCVGVARWVFKARFSPCSFRHLSENMLAMRFQEKAIKYITDFGQLKKCVWAGDVWKMEFKRIIE